MSKFMILGFALLLVTGCGSQIRPTGGLVGGYENFNAVDERTIKLRMNEQPEGVPIPPPAEDGSEAPTLEGFPTLFVIAPPEWSTEAFEDEPERRSAIMFTIRERLYRYLLREYPHPVRVRYAVTSDSGLNESHRVVVIRTKVTDVRRGQGLIRYLVGYVGQARIQLEGQFYEGVHASAPFGEFVFRIGHAGYAQNGLNAEVINDEYALKYAVEEGITLLTDDLPAFLPGVVKELPSK